MIEAGEYDPGCRSEQVISERKTTFDSGGAGLLGGEKVWERRIGMKFFKPDEPSKLNDSMPHIPQYSVFFCLFLQLSSTFKFSNFYLSNLLFGGLIL